MGKLDGKVAILTGAGSGIARASALLFAREGAKVAIAEINAEAGRAAESEIRKAGGDALFIETDVTQEASVKAAIAATVAKFGRLDVLMNCAGGTLSEDVPVHEMDLAVWQRTIALNLLHPFLVCRYGIPHLIKAGGGTIVNVVSHVGLMGSARPAYAAAKGGIMSFTKTLAAQYVDYGIRADAVAPGSVPRARKGKDREGMLSAKPGLASRMRIVAQKLYPFSIGKPEDIAAVVLFLACDDSRMITGTTVAADGGRSSYIKMYAPEGVTLALLGDDAEV